MSAPCRAAVSVVLAALAAGRVAPAAAQGASDPVPGQRVRVTTPAGGRRIVGRLLERSDGELVVQVDTSQVRHIDARDVRRLEVSLGRRSMAGVGASVGAAVGAVAGTVYGLHTSTADTCHPGGWLDPFGCAGDAGFRVAEAIGHVVVSGFAGGVAGALLGGVIGLSARHEAWRDAPPGRVRPQVLNLPGGRIGLGVAMAF